MLESEVRPLDTTEMEQVAIIWNQHFEQITTSKKQVTAESLAGYVDAHPEIEIIGYLDYTRSNQYILGFASIEKQEDSILISQIAVFEDVMHRGIGSGLLEYLKERSRAEGKDLVCYVQVINVPSLRFFLRHGFEIQRYEVEQEYVPKDFDPNSFEQRLRLVEYYLVLSL